MREGDKDKLQVDGACQLGRWGSAVSTLLLSATPSQGTLSLMAGLRAQIRLQASEKGAQRKQAPKVLQCTARQDFSRSSVGFHAKCAKDTADALVSVYFGLGF